MKACKYLVLLFLLFLPAAVNAQTKTTPPTLVIRVNSIDALLENVKFLANLAGQKDAVRQIEGIVKTQIGDKGLPGVDTSRPVGAYGRIGKELDDISGAIMLPIADEKAFLDLLKNFNVQTIKGDDGIYTVKTGTPIDAYLRFANKYAYITALIRGNLEEKNLLDPAKVLAGKPTTAFSLTIQLSQIPDAAKLITSAQAEQVLQEHQDKTIPGETPAQKAFRVASLKEAARVIAMVLKDGGELHTDVDFDRKTGDVAASFSLAGVSGSELAKGIDAISKNPSMFAGLMKKDTVFSGLGHLKLPEPLVKAFGDVIDEARTTALGSIQDAGKKQQAENLFKVLLPTFKTGDFDGAAVVTNKGKQLTFVGAFKVKGGNELGKTVRDLVKDSLKDLPPAMKDKIKLDVDAVGATKIHKVELPTQDAASKMAESLLGELSLYVAFRDDAMFIAAGKEGLQAIKEAIPVRSAGTTSPILFLELDVARHVYFGTPQQMETAKKLFPDGKGGTVRFSIQGGQAITVRLNTKVAVLQFLGQMHEMKGN